MSTDIQRPAADDIDHAYREFAPFVRRQLFTLGVRTADLPDMCHEVFVVLNQHSERLDQIERVDLWLREVCRRAAGGYRRRPQNAREVLMTDADLTANADAPTTGPGDDPLQRPDGDRVTSALDRLDDESRDLLALHDVGDLPLTELAKLVERDRKTVRKRLEAARRRLSQVLAEDGVGVVSADPSRRDAGRSPDGPPRYARELEIATVTPNVTIGFLGNVVIAIWPGIADLESIEVLSTEGPKLIKRCGKIGYLSVVETTIRPPPLPARKRIVRALDEMGPDVLGYATVVLTASAWIVRPIMSGLVVLSRPRFPMRFFSSMAAGSDWLCAHYARNADGPISSTDLMAAAERLRVIQQA